MCLGVRADDRADAERRRERISPIFVSVNSKSSPRFSATHSDAAVFAARAWSAVGLQRAERDDCVAAAAER